MRKPYRRTNDLWDAFLRTSPGRQLLREGVLRRTKTSTLTSLPLSRRAKLWLAAVILLALLATMVGAWISATTLNHQRMDDDTAWSRLSAPLHHSQRVRPSEKDLPATYDRRPFTNKLI